MGSAVKKTCPECGKEFDTNRSKREYCDKACSNRAITRRREDERDARQRVIVWSCGGGVQSSAIAALIIQGRLPKPDYALMVDVGYEKTSSWENVTQVLQPALADVGVNLQIISTTDYRDNTLFDKTDHLLIPGFRLMDDGFRSHLHTHCSGPWKLKVAMKWLREQGVQAARNWVGITTDEQHRMKESPVDWLVFEYPLIRLRMDRVDCHVAISKMGWKRVLHSSCYICPKQSDEQWRYIRHNYPDDWARAVEIDNEIRQHDSRLYLHRSCIPLVDWIEQSPGLAELSCGGGCEYCD